MAKHKTNLTSTRYNNTLIRSEEYGTTIKPVYTVHKTQLQACGLVSRRIKANGV